MPVTKDNSIYEKTSFLSKSNSAFIESMYLKYINSDPELPQSWNEFFDGLGDETKYIICLLYTSPSPRDGLLSRMPSSA